MRSQNAALADFLGDLGKAAPLRGALDDTPVHAAVRQIESSFDDIHGGHRGAPKFPHCPEMELLLDAASPTTVEFTLQRMADGGIHDQLGGGFCRYSVDERWEIPHFEKMLYDNAQLLPLYANFESDSFRAAASGIVAWLRREMISPNGGFYSALDADSEHEEGKFYVWQRDEVRALLDENEFTVADRYFGFDRAPNFEGHAWNPIVASSVDAIAASLHMPREEVSKAACVRESKTFRGAHKARAARSGRQSIDVVECADDFRSGARIAATWRQLAAANRRSRVGKSVRACLAQWQIVRDIRDSPQISAYLDDYAFLLDALIECLQNRWSSRDLHWAIALADAMLGHFEDRDAGGFFFTADDHEILIQRPKPWADEAIPSGNGVAARSLLRLGHLIGNTTYTDAAERTLRAAFSFMQQNPASCATLQRALREFLHPRTHVVIRADANNEEKLAESGIGTSLAHDRCLRHPRRAQAT